MFLEFLHVDLFFVFYRVLDFIHDEGSKAGVPWHFRVVIVNTIRSCAIVSPICFLEIQEILIVCFENIALDPNNPDFGSVKALAKPVKSFVLMGFHNGKPLRTYDPAFVFVDFRIRTCTSNLDACHYIPKFVLVGVLDLKGTAVLLGRVCGNRIEGLF